jgi:hypothetical protein
MTDGNKSFGTRSQMEFVLLESNLKAREGQLFFSFQQSLQHMSNVTLESFPAFAGTISVAGSTSCG